jgi:hypothetical protein
VPGQSCVLRQAHCRAVRPVRWLLAAALAWAVPCAQALQIDPKALARFDVTYAQCETIVAAMRGHRDQTFLSLWSVKFDARVRTELATVRASRPYLSERQLIRQAAIQRPSPAAQGVLEQECRTLWEQTRRAIETKP